MNFVIWISILLFLFIIKFNWNHCLISIYSFILVMHVIFLSDNQMKIENILIYSKSLILLYLVQYDNIFLSRLYSNLFMIILLYVYYYLMKITIFLSSISIHDLMLLYTSKTYLIMFIKCMDFAFIQQMD